MSSLLEAVASSTAEEGIPIQMALQFALDGISCEYAYVVDMDERKFEIFAGHMEKERAANTRFNEVPPKENPGMWHMFTPPGMVPCWAITFPFDGLPTTEEEFVETVTKAIKKRDEDGEKEDGEENAVEDSEEDCKVLD